MFYIKGFLDLQSVSILLKLGQNPLSIIGGAMRHTPYSEVVVVAKPLNLDDCIMIS
jgi:hypothetical protein